MRLARPHVLHPTQDDEGMEGDEDEDEEGMEPGMAIELPGGGLLHVVGVNLLSLQGPT